MKFRTRANTLEKALGTVSGAVPRKSTLPILETILFESVEGNLRLTATDLDVAIVDHIDADIQQEGAVAIPAQRITDTLKRLPDVPVSFEVDSKFNIKFRTDKGTYQLVGEDPDDFPNLPGVDGGQVITTTNEKLQRVIAKTMFATSTDDLRPSMMGVYFQMDTEESTFVATNGHQLCEYVKHDITVGEPIDFIVPSEALSLVKKSIREEECNITVTKSHILFSSGDTTVISRLINEDYPNYESVIPSDNNKLMHVDKDQLSATVKRVSIFSHEGTNQVRLLAEDGKLTLSAEDIDMSSEAKESISCDFDGESLEIGFNAKYLSDVLGNADGEEVQFAFSSPNRAGIVTPAEEVECESMRMLIMPIMLNSYA